MILDTKKYETKVAGVWNAFIDKFRGTDYDYLMIVANDMVADSNAIDFMVRCAEENPDAGMITSKVERDIEKFNANKGKIEYTSELTSGLIDPACFLLRKGIVEKVGRIDEYFPGAFVERDLIHRIKLAGYEVIQPEIVLWYHPPYSGTLGNDIDELDKAYTRYVRKWGGDANAEQFRNPMNDISLDFTYCIQ